MEHVKTARPTRRLLGVVLILSFSSAPAVAGQIEPSRWADYLDFAYVYSSADAKTLEDRLAQYGREAGISLEDYMVGYLGSESGDSVGLGDDKIRRQAVGFLLMYLVRRDSKLIDRSSNAIRKLRGQNASLDFR